MTMNDAFDARLKAAFADAAAPLERDSEAEAFAKTVTDRLNRPDRKRVLILGGAGSTGSAIAGTQLESIFGNITVPSGDGVLAGAALLASPEVLAAGAVALAVALVAVVLPRRIV